MHPIAASERYDRALRAVADLLSRLRIEAAFTGGVAGAAWLGAPVASGSIDVIALMGAQQKNQLAMMASNRGFRVEKDEIEAAEELDLVPLHHDEPEGEVRIHVLVASNALYGRMVGEGVDTRLGDLTIRVPRIEDFALLLQVSNDVTGLMELLESPDFDRDYYNKKLISIGLGAMAVPE